MHSHAHYMLMRDVAHLVKADELDCTAESNTRYNNASCAGPMLAIDWAISLAVTEGFEGDGYSPPAEAFVNYQATLNL